MADMTKFEQAVDQVVEDSERLHKVVNGAATETVVTEDGSLIPTVRKAFLDNLFFKTPPLPWVAGQQTTVFNQLYAYTGERGVQWWYAPGATESSPVTLPTNPVNNVNWRLYNDSESMSQLFAPIDSPIFTGNPQAPTPSADSNSTTLATTQFVTRAIATALAGIAGGNGTFADLTVTGLASLNTLSVGGVSTFNGPVNADNQTGKFQNLILTKDNSSLSFAYSDDSNPTFIKTRLEAYSAQTHQLHTDIIINGVPVADNTTMSFTGLGNNTFDYVYITGNSKKDPSEARLKVSGMTELENLKITGTVTGLSFSVNGEDISPNSVTTAQGVTVGGDLQVNGNTNLNSTTCESLEVTNNLVVNGQASLKDFSSTTGNVTGLLTLGEGFTATGDGSIGGDLTVNGTSNLGKIVSDGDVVLNRSSGTTTVNNLIVKGTVSGITIDLTGQNVNVASLSSQNSVTTNQLFVNGQTQLSSTNVSFLTLQSEEVGDPTATWTPSGTSNIYNVTVNKNLTIGAWPDPQQPFSAMIYLTQDATGGHSVTLDPNYVVLNSETVNTAANSVTILQLTFNGVEDGVVDTVIVRRPQP